MEEEIKKRLDAQDEWLQKIFVSVEKTRKYFLWTMIITLAVVILPLLGLLIIVPNFIDNYSSTLNL